jgi:hypothetical protein
MTTQPPDFRALCEELADRLQRAITSTQADFFYGEDRDAIDAARAALNTPPLAPIEPDTDQVLRLAAIIRKVDGNNSLGAAALAEAILSHLAPIPVSERLPGPEDCDAEGRHWCFTPREDVDGHLILHARWILSRLGGMDTHWLPHWPIPLPQEVKE